MQLSDAEFEKLQRLMNFFRLSISCTQEESLDLCSAYIVALMAQQAAYDTHVLGFLIRIFDNFRAEMNRDDEFKKVT